MNDTNSLANINVRRLALVALGGLAILLILYMAYLAVIAPKLTISAPANSTVIIYSLPDMNQAAHQTITTNQSQLTLNPGNYMVSIEQNGVRQVDYLSLSDLSNRRVSFDSTVTPLSSQLVTNGVTYSPLSANGQISYLDTTQRSLMSINAVGASSQPYDPSLSGQALPHPIQFMGTIANNQAIIEQNNILFVLRNNQLTHLKADILPPASTWVYSAIATNSGLNSFALLVNKSVYWYASPDDEPVKVMDLPKIADQIAYGGNQIIAYSTRMPPAVENIKASYVNYAIDPLLINVNAKSQKTLTSGPIVDASIAPDGQHAIVQSEDAKSATLFNLASVEAQGSVESPHIVTPFWIDNNTFVYSDGSYVLHCDISKMEATTIGSFVAGLEPTSITYNSSENAYYVSTYPSENGASLYRLSAAPLDANTQKAASLAAAVNTSTQFQFKFFNITQPTLEIFTSTLNHIDHNEYIRETQQARQAALQYLQSNGVDPSKLNIVYNPSDPL